ncbi:MAG: ParA family protein [Azospirillaceae bacterium]|nr:ParA family protein [Azospirillaceae bacterium]
MNSSDGEIGPLRIVSAFARILANAAERADAAIMLIDVGPNLGAINRAALIAADFVAIPLGPDLFSLQGLRNLGPSLREWRDGWSQRRSRNKKPDVVIPGGEMLPAGYIMVRHSVRMDRPVKAFDRWMKRVPSAYRTEMLQEPPAEPDVKPETDPHCLGRLKDYRSLMALAQEANKPMFMLRPADGAIGGHQAAVTACYQDFKALSEKIAERCHFPVRDPLADLLG